MVFIILVALTLISGACANSIGGGVSVTSTNRGHAEGFTIAKNDVAATQISFESSNVNYYNWLDDVTGKHVDELLDVTQGTGSYNFEFRKEGATVEPTDPTINHLVPASLYLSAEGALSVTSAKMIHLSANASNGENDRAYVFADLWDGVTSGYSSNSLDAALELNNEVYTDSIQSTASQSGYAYGGKILLGSKGRYHGEEGAEANTDIRNGGISAYEGSVFVGGNSSMGWDVSAQQIIGLASGYDGVWVNGGAYNKEGNSIAFQIATGKGMLPWGLLEDYKNSANASSTQLSGQQHAYVVEGDFLKLTGGIPEE